MTKPPNHARVAPHVLCVLLVLIGGRGVFAQAPAAPAGAPPAPVRGGRGPLPVDPRVQIRMHHLADTNEDIPYALFVSSRVDPKKKVPMIGGDHGTVITSHQAAIFAFFARHKR